MPDFIDDLRAIRLVLKAHRRRLNDELGSLGGITLMRWFSKTALFIVTFTFGLEVASAKLIHDWTVKTPLGEFGYVELGGEGFPTEGDFLFGRFFYIQTGIGSSIVIAAGGIFLICVVALAGWATHRSIQKRTYRHVDA